MPTTMQPGYTSGYTMYGAGGQPYTAATWSNALLQRAQTKIADAFANGAPGYYLPGFGTIKRESMLSGGTLDLQTTALLQQWANSPEVAQNQDIVNGFMDGKQRPAPQPNDYVPTEATAKALSEASTNDLKAASAAIALSSGGIGGSYSSPSYSGLRTSAGSGSGSSYSPGDASPDAQLAASLRREELAYQKEKDALDRALARSQVIAQLGQNPADAVQREVFLRTGMEPVGQTVNMFTGQPGPTYTTLSNNMQTMTNAGVFGQNPTLPAGQAPFVPYAAGGPGYANGTEITPDGWTTAKKFIVGDPQRPWEVNPERVELRVVNGEPQAKVTPINGPQYQKIASMSYGTEAMYPWGTEGDSPPPATGTDPTTPGTDGTTPTAPAFDPTKQYMDKDGRIRNYSEQQLSGLTQSAWDTQQLDAQRKAGAATALLANKRFTAGISAEELKTLQDMASKFDPWLFDRLKQRYRPKWDTGSGSEMFDPSIVGYPVLAPATRTRGVLPPGTTPPAPGTPPYNQPVQVFWGNRSPGWGGTWKAPTPPTAPSPTPRPATPPAGSAPAPSNWGSEGSQQPANWGTGSVRHATRPMYADGTEEFPYGIGDQPTPQSLPGSENDPLAVAFANRDFWIGDKTADGKAITINDRPTAGVYASINPATGKPWTYGEAYQDMLYKQYTEPQWDEASNQYRVAMQFDQDTMTGQQQRDYWAATSAGRLAAPGKPVAGQSTFQMFNNYTPGDNVPAVAGNASTFGTVAQTPGSTTPPTGSTAAIGGTYIGTGAAQFKTDQPILVNEIKPEWLEKILILGPDGVWYKPKAGDTIPANTTMFVGTTATAKEGSTTGFINPVSNPSLSVVGATLQTVKPGQQQVTGAGSYNINVEKDEKGNPIPGTGMTVSLNYGDYIITNADGSQTPVRYNATLNRWMAVPGQAVPITSEKEFMALPEKTRADILSGKNTQYVLRVTTPKKNASGKYIIGGPEWTNPDWFTNMMVGMNTFAQAPNANRPPVTQEEFSNLPKEVQTALLNGTPLPEGYEQYGGLTGYSMPEYQYDPKTGIYSTSARYSPSSGVFSQYATGGYRLGQPSENYVPYNYEDYQNQSSPPGPAMAGHHWEYIDPNTGNVTKKVR